MAEIEPLEREARPGRCPNGLRVSERRIPIGTVGANFEARPNVALDVAGQLLKSLNAAVLRTGGAALGTVTVLVDDVLRPALEASRASAGRGRARPLAGSRGRAPARLAAAPDPARDPARERRDDRCARTARGRERRPDARARRGWRRPLRPRLRVAREGARARGGEPRPARRLQPAQPRARRPRGGGRRRPRCSRCSRRRASRCAGTSTAPSRSTAPLGHEWASDPERVATVTIALVDGLDEAVRVANEETSGLAAGIVAEDEEAAERFLDGYRGTAAFWHATTRFTDGFELTGAPETGINVDWAPGPRGPVTYRDLWLRQYRIVGDGTETPVTVVVKLGSSLVAGAGGTVRRTRAAPPRDRDRGDRRAAASPSPSCRRARSRSACRSSGLERRPRALPKLQAASALGQARLQQAWERALAREGVRAAQILLTAGDVADRAAYVNARNALTALFALGAVPIVNENDATATDEIAFGDNDALAAQVAILVRARLLVLLTEVDGVYTRAPGTPGAQARARGVGRRRRRLGDGVDARTRRDARARSWPRGWPPEAGIPTVIAGRGRDGRARADPRRRAARDAVPRRRARALRVQALAALREGADRARSTSTTGARRAVADQGRSLLAVGVARCEGRFDAGDAVELVGPDGIAFARGVAGAGRRRDRASAR